MKTNNIIINSIMRKYIKHLCAILILLCTSASAWGATSYTATYTVTSKTAVSSTGTNPSGSSATFSQSGNNEAGQMTANGTTTLTLSGYDGKKITAISLYIRKTSGSKTAAVTANTGGSEFCNYTIASNNLSTSFATSQVSLSSTPVIDEDATIIVGIKASANSVYISAYTITWEDATPHDVSFVTGEGNPSIATLTGVSVTLPDEEDLVPACSSDGWELYGWTTSAYGSSSTTTAPTATLVGYGGDTYWPDDDVTLYAVYTKVATNEAATAQTLSFEHSSTWTKYHYTDKSSYWLIHGDDGYIESPKLNDLSTITSIVVQAGYFGGGAYGHFQLSGNGTNYGSEQVCSNNSESTSITISPDTNPLSGSGKIKLLCTGTASSDNGVRVKTITINYTAPPSYYWSAPTCAACEVNPTLETPTLTSITSGTITVSCPSISAGENCTISDYGFVWKAGSQPTISDNKTQVGTDDRSTAYNSALSISFTTGTTYNIKAYATNGHGTALSTTLAVTPQSVTFNSNGGSSVATQYVNNGGTVSAPSDPTKSGFVFGGWFQESGLSTPVDWSAAITADKTYYAKWLTYSDYVFSCAELTLEPHLVTTSTPIFITSSASKKVRSQDYIQIIGSGLTPSTTLTFPDLPDAFEIRTATYGNLETDASGAIDASAYIFYTPAADATSDGLDKITGITVTVGGAKTKTVSLTQDIIGRHLPADFVIAGKKDGKWWALPSDMASTTNPKPSEIAINDINNPSVAYTDASNKYGLAAPTASNISGGNGQYIRLTMSIEDGNDPAGPAPLFGSATGTRTLGKSSNAKATSDLSAGWWWQLKQTNTSITNPQDAKYTIYCANNTSSLSLRDNAGNPDWGLFASGVEELRLIPASSVVFTEAEIVAWGQHNAIVEVDRANAGGTGVAAEKVKAKLNGEESSLITLAETGTSKGSTTKYDYTVAFGDVIDFAANEGQMLTLEWYNSSDALIAVSNIIVPRVIATTNTMYTISTNDPEWNTEVHVLPGVTLTADAGSFPSSDVSIKELNIYPGATVNVTTGTLKATTLVMRNGWDRLNGDKKYDVARLYITPTNGNLQAGTAYADWYIDFDQYYPIAVPWTVTTSEMRYKNTRSTASAGVKMRYYDGASRATNGQTGVGESTNWKVYDVDGKAYPATLEPSKGYAMTAKRPVGKAFSIVRMPLTIPSAEWTNAGEKGEVSDTHKDQVTVTAHGKDDPSKPTYTTGWNFIANPYMSLYGGTIEYSDETKVKFVNIPDVDFKEFGQYATATTKLKPASGFLIQAPKDGTLTFGTSKRAAAAPSYRNATKEVAKEQQAYILLANDAAEDMMGILVSEKYTADYELNADLEKLLSDGNTLRTYMRYNDLNMAYLAINEELAKQLIPVCVRIPADGEYTFRIQEASIADELEGIYLTDYQTNTVTNLLYDSYTFNAVAGTDNVRFAINAVIGKREVPTGVDISGSDKDRPTKFIWNDKVYILHNNVIYDSTGKRVNVINK